LPQLVAFAIAILFAVFLVIRAYHSFPIPFALLAGASFTYVAFITSRHIRRSAQLTWDTYVLEIGPDYCFRTSASTPDLRLPFSEIRSIEHIPGRFLCVTGSSRQRVIIIPESIEHLPEILSTLSAIQPIKETRSDSSLKGFLFTLLGVANYFLLIASTDPHVVLPLAIVLTGILLWMFVTVRRSPNAAYRAKRNAWTYLVFAASCIFKLLLTLGLVHL
jgi:hypothetical protein